MPPVRSRPRARSCASHRCDAAAARHRAGWLRLDCRTVGNCTVTGRPPKCRAAARGHPYAARRPGAHHAPHSCCPRADDGYTCRARYARGCSETGPVSPPEQLLMAIVLPIAAVYSLIGGGPARWVPTAGSRSAGPARPPPSRSSGCGAQPGPAARPARGHGDPHRPAGQEPAPAGAAGRLRRRPERGLPAARISPPASAARASPGDIRRAEIYRVEAALRERGLDVREKAGR